MIKQFHFNVFNVLAVFSNIIINIPLMNIDGINFGSDDYYNDFYDGDFELVDDAVIPYQEEDNEWFSDTSFENPNLQL